MNLASIIRQFTPKNKSVYETSRVSLEAGKRVTLANEIQTFDFQNVDFDYYIAEAMKLVISV